MQAEVREALATALLRAREAAACLPLPSERMPGFTRADAFEVAAATVARRQAAGDAVRGWKIGFTNRSIWPRYGVHAPIWAPVWASTLEMLPACEAALSLAAFSQPRLEPEIVFGFGRAPAPGASRQELVASLDWVAHGFEVVHTHFDGWRFTAPDTVADFGLHGRLLVGPRRPVADLGADGSAAGADTFADRLAILSLTLGEGSRPVDQGRGSAVLDGPIQALEHWLDAMTRETPDWRVQPGDVVTTGTITDAAPLLPGQHWWTETDDPLLPGLRLETRG